MIMIIINRSSSFDHIISYYQTDIHSHADILELHDDRNKQHTRKHTDARDNRFHADTSELLNGHSQQQYYMFGYPIDIYFRADVDIL